MAAKSEFVILMLGDFGVGKKTLVDKYVELACGGEVEEDADMNSKFVSVSVNGKNISLQIMLPKGMDRNHSVTTSYYRNANGIVIVFDVTNTQSLASVKDWMADVKKLASKNVKCIVVGNKCDLKEQRTVTEERAKKVAGSELLTCEEVSAETGDNVVKVFRHLLLAIMNEPPDDSSDDDGTVDINGKGEKAKGGCPC